MFTLKGMFTLKLLNTEAAFHSQLSVEPNVYISKSAILMKEETKALIL